MYPRKMEEIIFFCTVCYRWLLLNMTDPTGQLSWLVSVLQQAETKGEKVMKIETNSEIAVRRTQLLPVVGLT